MPHIGHLAIIALGNVHTTVGVVTERVSRKKWKVRIGTKKPRGSTEITVTEDQIIHCGWVELSEEEKNSLSPNEVFNNHLSEILKHIIRLTAPAEKIRYIPPI